jgi:hypothetical protein
VFGRFSLGPRDEASLEVDAILAGEEMVHRTVLLLSTIRVWRSAQISSADRPLGQERHAAFES